MPTIQQWLTIPEGNHFGANTAQAKILAQEQAAAREAKFKAEVDAEVARRLAAGGT